MSYGRLVPGRARRQAKAINRCATGNEQGLAIFPPGDIGGRLSGLDRAQKRTVRRNDRQSAWSRPEDVPLPIHLESVRSEERILSPTGGIKEDPAVRDCPIRLYVIREPCCAFWIDIRNIECLFIRRKGNAVRSFDVLDKQCDDASLGQTIDPLHRGFARIIEEFWEAKRRISKIQIPVRLEHEIIRAVDLISIIAIC